MLCRKSRMKPMQWRQSESQQNLDKTNRRYGKRARERKYVSNVLCASGVIAARHFSSRSLKGLAKNFQIRRNSNLRRRTPKKQKTVVMVMITRYSASAISFCAGSCPMSTCVFGLNCTQSSQIFQRVESEE